MKVKHLILASAVIMMAAACSDALEERPAGGIVDETALGVPSESTDPAAVTMTEIGNIAAEMFGTSRSRSAQHGYTIGEIRDAEGNPSIYVLNRPNGGGFVLVSATKDYYPVLGYSDSGNFDIGGTEAIGGLEEWKDCIVGNIAEAAYQPADTLRKYRSMWHRYEDNRFEIKKADATRSISNSELTELQNIMMDSIMSWGTSVKIHNVTENIFGNTTEYENFLNLLQGVIAPEYMEYWEDLSVWVERTTVAEETKVDNFVQSTWGQDFGYNECFPLLNNGLNALAGCGPVAAGQVMRYFEHPASFDWDAMPLSYPTRTTSQLLRDIADKANADYEIGSTGTSIKDISDVITSYGYHIDYYNEDNELFIQNTIKANCVDKKPVITRGAEQKGQSGHMWVISGIDYRQDYHRYELWTFMSHKQFQRFPNDYLPKYSDVHYHYMNWGWYGGQNGFYLIPLTYIMDRYYLCNITPKK